MCFYVPVNKLVTFSYQIEYESLILKYLHVYHYKVILFDHSRESKHLNHRLL